MAEQRLPVVDGDDGVWGEILNQFLSKEHYDTGIDTSANGGHKTVTIRPGTAAAGTAPLKFSSGTLLSAPEAGAVEYNTDNLYFTQATGSIRKTIAAYDDSAGATGDLYYRDSAGAFVRLPVGSPNQVLTVDSGLPSWQTATGSATARTVGTALAPMTLANAAATDYVYFIGAAVTITMPTAVGNTNLYTVKNTSTGTVTIAAGETIDGSNTITLIPNQSVNLISDTINWQII